MLRYDAAHSSIQTSRYTSLVAGKFVGFEEPTIGLHTEDVARLIHVLHRLVDEGHTVVVVEHHTGVMAEADYLIDMGPEAGAGGGRVVVAGDVDALCASGESRTAPFVRQLLGRTVRGGRRKRGKA